MILSVSGTKFFYTDNGRPGVPTVVLIHGFPFDHTMWSNQLAILDPSFRVITFNLRGHGHSDLGDAPFLFETYVDDFLGLMDALDLPKVILCGLSMGGYIALRAAERAPKRVQGLILCDTRSEADSNEAKGKRAATVRAIRDKGVAPFVAGFLPSLFTPETLQRKPSFVEDICQVMSRSTPERLCSALVALATRTDTTPSLVAVKVPTLILVGEKDMITPPAVATDMAERIPQAKLHCIPNASHLSNLENAQAFNAALSAFMPVFV